MTSLSRRELLVGSTAVALGALPGAAFASTAQHSEFPRGANKKGEPFMTTIYYKDWAKDSL